MKKELVRVLRIIEYVGDRDWIEVTIQHAIHGKKMVCPNCSIQATTLGEFPEILQREEEK